MNLLSKIGLILLFMVLIYLWNRFVVRILVSSLVSFHKRNNSKNLDKQPIKFLVNNESYLIQSLAVFYWLGGAIIAFGILVSE